MKVGYPSVSIADIANIAGNPMAMMSLVDASRSDDVGIGASDTFETRLSYSYDISNAVGLAARVVNMYVDIQPVGGATAGTHRLEFHNCEGKVIATVVVNFNVAFSFVNSMWIGAVAAQEPSDGGAMMSAIRSLRYFEDTKRITIKYTNNTDAIKVGARQTHLHIEVVGAD